MWITQAEGAELKLGVKGGLSLASRDEGGDLFMPGVQYTTRKGVALAIDWEIPLVESFLWLRFEPMYVQKGSEVTWPGFTSYTSEENFCSLPICIKASADLGSLRPFLFLGPYFATAMSARYAYENDDDSFDVQADDFDWGLDMGAGIDLRVGRFLWLTIDARYSMGLDTERRTDGISWENRSLIVLSGILFER